MATSRSQVYKCGVCSAEVEVIGGGGGTLICCNQPMDLYVENTTDAAQEKHVPVVEKVDGGIKVKVGSVAHPMTDAHYIVWIEAIADGYTYRKQLTPAGSPEAFFPVEAEEITVRALCNLHGLWKS